MANFAILGGSGYLGSYLVAYLRSHGHRAISVSRSANASHDSVRVSGLRQIGPTIAGLSGEVDFVINTVAVASHEKCTQEPELAQVTNATMPGVWAKVSREANIRFIQISTDAVFDGIQEAPYSENDQPSPRSVYGRTKLDGEIASLDSNHDALVVRTNFFGWSPTRGSGVLEFFYQNLALGREIVGFTDYIVSSTYMGSVARGLVDLGRLGLSGTFHLAAKDSLSKYDFGVAVAGCFGLPLSSLKRGTVRDVPGILPRARNLGLSTLKFDEATGQASPTIHEALVMAKTELESIGRPDDRSLGTEGSL